MISRPVNHTRIEDLRLPVPNETRLLELQSLAHRKQEHVPGPGSYEVVSVTELRPGSSSRRRRHQPRLDGPFPLQPGECGLRSQQISSSLVLKDSGVSPAAYDGLIKKDVCLSRAPTPKIGTARRGGPAPLSADQLCLSVSRCLSSGLNWMVPLPLQQLQQQLTCATPSPGAAIKLRRSATDQRGLDSRAGARSSSPGQLQHGAADKGQRQHCTGCQHWRQQQQQQQPCQVGQLQQWHEAVAFAGARIAAKDHIPWQLARSIAEWDEVMQAVTEQQTQAASPSAAPASICQLQHATSGGAILHPQQRHLESLPEEVVFTADSNHPPRTAGGRVSNLGGFALPKGTRQAMVLQKEQVLQHESAARAAEAVTQLAARRQRWHELSGQYL